MEAYLGVPNLATEGIPLQHSTHILTKQRCLPGQRDSNANPAIQKIRGTKRILHLNLKKPCVSRQRRKRCGLDVAIP
jgi:hypothetical protein